ncbi:MAG: hypothetical protein KDI15_02840 [Thiothrix sp.]|nr:hypothetical protein [Thiothrix sp.]HPE61000.1 hypothetical protein [Thiolinea sp.]
MKFLVAFSVFALLHLAGWAGAHVWLSRHQSEVLLVVDTSYGLKPHFTDMEDWISRFVARTRYKTITVGTDKALLGPLDSLPSQSVIFRTAFGRMTEENLARYATSTAKRRILLSDGSIDPAGWEVVEFK